jgi:hypothetical protein
VPSVTLKAIFQDTAVLQVMMSSPQFLASITSRPSHIQEGMKSKKHLFPRHLRTIHPSLEHLPINNFMNDPVHTPNPTIFSPCSPRPLSKSHKERNNKFLRSIRTIQWKPRRTGTWLQGSSFSRGRVLTAVSGNESEGRDTCVDSVQRWLKDWWDRHRRCRGA